MRAIGNYLLYLIISGRYCAGRSALDIARRAIAGGVDMIQLREKDKPPGETLEIATQMAELCSVNGVLFIVNDDPGMANKSGADGVHLGKEDLERFPLLETRKLLGQGKIIGVSASSLSDVERFSGSDADYIGYGPIFETVVKDGCAGTSGIRDVMAASKKPVFFLGGIAIDNVDRVLDSGAKNISLIRAICAADDVEGAAKQFRRRLDERRKTSRTGKDTPGIF